MPIIAFSSFTGGVEPNRRSREHFITNINLEDGDTLSTIGSRDRGPTSTSRLAKRTRWLSLKIHLGQ
jgi:hypothetical protein